VKRLDVAIRRDRTMIMCSSGRRAALDRGFETMRDDLRSALSRLERQTQSRSGNTTRNRTPSRTSDE
jgi:ribonuclease P protein component